MKTRLVPTFSPSILLRASLLLLLIVSCAPQATQPASAPPVVELPSATLTPPVEPVEGAATQPPVATEPPLPIATSRGPNLEATDPSTVSLASGQYQFVEFFRFT